MVLNDRCVLPLEDFRESNFGASLTFQTLQKRHTALFAWSLHHPTCCLLLLPLLPVFVFLDLFLVLILVLFLMLFLILLLVLLMYLAPEDHCLILALLLAQPGSLRLASLSSVRVRTACQFFSDQNYDVNFLATRPK